MPPREGAAYHISGVVCLVVFGVTYGCAISSFGFLIGLGLGWLPAGIASTAAFYITYVPLSFLAALLR